VKKVWSWIRRNIWPLLAAIGTATAGLLFWKDRARERKRLSMKAAAAIARERAVLAEKLKEREALVMKSDSREAEIATIERAITESKRRVLKIHEREIPDNAADVARAFSQLGY